MIRRRFTQTVAAAALVLPLTACAEGDGDSTAKVDGTTKDISWGEHWAGAKMKRASDLSGKVVLLKIWGG